VLAIRKLARKRSSRCEKREKTAIDIRLPLQSAFSTEKKKQPKNVLRGHEEGKGKKGPRLARGTATEKERPGRGAASRKGGGLSERNFTEERQGVYPNKIAYQNSDTANSILFAMSYAHRERGNVRLKRVVGSWSTGQQVREEEGDAEKEERLSETGKTANSREKSLRGAC